MASTLQLINKLGVAARKITGQRPKGLPEDYQFIVNDAQLSQANDYKTTLANQASKMDVRNNPMGADLYNALLEHFEINKNYRDLEQSFPDIIPQVKFDTVLESLKQMSAEEFLNVLVKTQKVTIGTASNSQLNAQEMAILNNIVMAATITVFQDSPSTAENKTDIPFRAQAIFTHLDFNAAESNIDNYFKERILPILIQANNAAEQAGKQALVVLPDLTKSEQSQQALDALIQMIEEKAKELPHLRGVCMDSYGVTPNDKAGHVNILLKRDFQTVPSLAHPSDYGSQYKDCLLVKVVKGNPFVYQNSADLQSSEQQDIAKLTNLFQVLAGDVAKGHFDDKTATFTLDAASEKPDWQTVLKEVTVSSAVANSNVDPVPVLENVLAESKQLAQQAAEKFSREIDNKRNDHSIPNDKKAIVMQTVQEMESIATVLKERFLTAKSLIKEGVVEAKSDIKQKSQNFQVLANVFRSLGEVMKNKINHIVNPQPLRQSVENPLYEKNKSTMVETNNPLHPTHDKQNTRPH